MDGVIALTKAEERQIKGFHGRWQSFLALVAEYRSEWSDMLSDMETVHSLEPNSILDPEGRQEHIASARYQLDEQTFRLIPRPSRPEPEPTPETELSLNGHQETDTPTMETVLTADCRAE